ncbi:MAG: hypothetical protein KGZ74_03180 [Chitinophagaceae bacterium]|nr:hypothetical protein [Chitinophagaceae bacterium]
MSNKAFSQNECATAVTLTSNTSCNNTNINLNSATASTGIPLGCDAAGTYNDFWYTFTAVSTTHTITLSNLGTRITNPRIQLYSGTCGSLTSVACSSSPHTSLTQTGLTVGATYYVRISQYGAFGATGNYRADICITHPQSPPANDNCSGAITLSSSTTCSNTTGNLFYATSTATATSCGSGTFYDVWYSFTATATTHAITLSSLGGSLSASSTYIQVLSGTCGSLTNVACGTASSRLVINTLTTGTTYYVRIYITTNPTVLPSSDWNFNICVQNGPSNDECAGAITLTPGAACTNTAGSLDLATANASTPTATCTGTMYDVWYRFTATSTTHNITASSLGANIANPRIHVYTGACGSLVQFGCATSGVYSSAVFVIGVSYFVRVSNATTDPSGTGSTASFNICITNSTTSAPANDACSSPEVITSSTTCNRISGTLFNATGSTTGQITNTCGANQTAPDVWYSFVAQSAYPNIIFRNTGIPVGGGGNRAAFQLLSASSLCTNSYTSLVCNLYNNSGSDNTITTTSLNSGAGLTVGQTYYIRIFSNQAGPATSAWTFNLCVQDQTSTFLLETAKGYLNVTKQNGGGSIDSNDVLEIRATFSLSGTSGTTPIDSISFYDTLRAGAGFRLETGTLALRTNEGKIYGSAFTEAAGDDAGFAVGSGAGTDTVIRMNIGNGANASRGGSVTVSTGSPTPTYPKTAAHNYLVMATYRVRVNRTYGTKINFGGGSFRYRNRTTGVFETMNFPADSLIVYASPSICPNATSASNVIGDESNGTFGSQTTGSMPNHNRTASPNTTYQFLNFSNNTPNDNYYGITSNTAAAGTVTNKNLAIPAAAGNRVFTVWDISGDHTGAADVNQGNPPCNTSLPVSSTNPCGYMMVFNSAYKMDTAFQFNVANACPNTFYEVSAWFKNVCYKCGQDSMGRGQWSGASYIPTATNDTAGVRPNVSIKINNLDYYTTGDIQHQATGVNRMSTTADSANRWLFRAFVYQTDSVTNNFTLTFRNNAPGGGGNDWAIDDISFKTCSPTLEMTPSASTTFCENNQVNMQVRVASYYNMYQYYQWERSTDGGNTWSAAPESPSVQTFTYSNISGEYRDTVSYPSIIANNTTNGYRYRVRVATTAAGISNSCAVFNTDDVIVINLATSGCNALPTEVLKFNAQLNGDKTRLTWHSREDQLKGYTVERSDNGINFHSIGYVSAKGTDNNEVSYLFNDPVSVSGKVYYRLKLDNATGNNTYSNTLTVTLMQHQQMEITNLVNPFRERISFQLNAVRNEEVQLQLADALGHPILNKKIQVFKGGNTVAFEVPQHLAKGSYVLRIVSASGTVNKIIQKQ